VAGWMCVLFMVWSGTARSILPLPGSRSQVGREETGGSACRGVAWLPWFPIKRSRCLPLIVVSMGFLSCRRDHNPVWSPPFATAGWAGLGDFACCGL